MPGDDTLTARYRYRLRVTPTQQRKLQAVFDSCRFVWNTALGRWGDLWDHERVTLGYLDMNKELTDWRSRFDWLAAIPRVPQVQTLRDLDLAIHRFWDPKDPVRRPRFKRKGDVMSARWDTNGFALNDSRLSVVTRGGYNPRGRNPGGRVDLRVIWSRPLPSEPKTVSVRRDAAGRWWATFVVQIEPENIGATGQTTGLDLGLRVMATTEYPDADIPNPRFARRAEKALARSRRNMDRKTPGSRNRAKAKHTNAKVHAKVTDQRHDHTHKQARRLARRFDRIGIEDLKIRNMMRRGPRRTRAGLSRAMGDVAWGDFRLALEWQAKKCGHEIIRINPTNTSQTCSQCGTKAKIHLGMAATIFACDTCGLVLNRDVNAARNLNPDRQGKTVRVGQGDNGRKTRGLPGRRAT